MVQVSISIEFMAKDMGAVNVGTWIGICIFLFLFFLNCIFLVKKYGFHMGFRCLYIEKIVFVIYNLKFGLILL